jgi:adenylate kinase
LGFHTPLGIKAKSFIEAGKLVPDEVVLEMLFQRIGASDCLQGFLLDGFPRTIPQADALGAHLAAHVKDAAIIVLNLVVPDGVIVQRAEGRLTCRGCGMVYNKYSSPSKVSGQCDKCQGELYQRPDDAMSVVQERLKVYYEQSNPLVDYYTAKGLLKTISGEGARESVYQNLKKHVNFDA